MEILFYTKEGKTSVLELSESFYKWLALSEFSKIQTSRKFTLKVDEEEVLINAIELNEQTRLLYISFFQKCILKESYDLVKKMEINAKPGLLKASSSEGSLENLQYRIKKFYEFLQHIEDISNLYMEYI
jgi:hypothetical protein